MMAEEIVYKRQPFQAKPGWSCPRCWGIGTNGDGSCSITPDEVRIRSATKCFLCAGTGRVHCTPATEPNSDPGKESP
jgi:hypothetical protein